MLQNLSVEEYLKLLFWEETLIFLFGIYVGAFIIILLVGKLHTKTKKIDSKHFDKISFVKLVDEDGKSSFLISDTKSNSTYEAMRGLVLMIFSFLFVPKGYVVRSEKKAKVIAKILIATSILVSILAIIAIIDTYFPFVISNTITCCL